ADRRLFELRVGDAYAGQILATEHEIELREAEHEGIATVDDGDRDLVRHLIGQRGCQFKAGKASAQYEHGLHRISVPRKWATVRRIRSGRAAEVLHARPGSG